MAAPLTGHRTTAAEGAETRAQLIAVARGLFAENGHAGVSTVEICDYAGVTRGALYHHFPGKDALFEAVCEQVADEVSAHVVAAANEGRDTDTWARVRNGCHAFIDACTGEDVRQILLTDAPSVLGWVEFRKLDRRHALGLLEVAIAHAMDEGTVPRGDAKVLAHVLVAALNEASLVVGQADDPDATRRSAIFAIDRLLDGIGGSGS
jgi:AcrR family transcriptional regulator